MTTANAGSAGDDSNTGGAGGDSGSNDGGADGTENEDTGGDEGDRKVSFKDHQRAVSDLLKFKNKAKQSESRVAALEAEVAAMKEAQIKPDDYKAKLETTSSKLKDAEEKAERLQAAVQLAERHRAILPELQKAGFRADASELLDLADLSELEVEVTSNGRFLVSGVNDWVESFKKKHPYAFDKQKTKVYGGGGGAAGGGDSEWTAQRVTELEVKLKRERKWETAAGKAEYAAAVEAFRKARKK